jgi:hypothetical protein
LEFRFVFLRFKFILYLIILVLFPVLIGLGLFFPKETTVESSKLQAQLTSSQALAVIDDSENVKLLDALREASDELKSEHLNVGFDKLTYTEIRNGSPRSFTDVEKEIALRIIDLATGEVKKTKIIKKGGELIETDDNFSIEAVTRTNGIRWNNFNTIFRVLSPPHQAVLAVKYPLITDYRWERVKERTALGVQSRLIHKPIVEEVIYAPYSPELHFAELIAEGKRYLEKIDFNARSELNIRKVRSRAMPGKLVTEVVSSDWIRKLPLLEQTDFGEFVIDPRRSFERVLWILGANKERAYQYTQSSASALGWVQFIPATYKSIVSRLYKEAALKKDFESGARDHLSSLMAAYLLYDYNLAELVRRFGLGILEDQLLEEYLAASYNGKPSRTFASISQFTAARRRHTDWTSELKNETKEFLAKLRYLKTEFVQTQR